MAKYIFEDVSATDIGVVVRRLLDTPNARKVTLYLSPKLTVKASRMAYPRDKKRGHFDRRATRADTHVTVGAPNYEERRFIKACAKAGEPFPVKKMQIKLLPGA